MTLRTRYVLFLYLCPDITPSRIIPNHIIYCPCTCRTYPKKVDYREHKTKAEANAGYASQSYSNIRTLGGVHLVLILLIFVTAGLAMALLGDIAQLRFAFLFFSLALLLLLSVLLVLHR